MVIEQFVNLLDHRGRGDPSLPRFQRQRQPEGPVSAALEADLYGNLLVPAQGDVFQKQPDHAFAFPVWRGGITP
ncbi:hypothetical protein D3C72_2211160 [compost metagenome]